MLSGFSRIKQNPYGGYAYDIKAVARRIHTDSRNESPLLVGFEGLRMPGSNRFGINAGRVCAKDRRGFSPCSAVP